MSLNEFSIIETYFKKPSTVRKDILLGIGDDCAVLIPPKDRCLLVSTDTLNVNVHFFPSTAAFDLGYKSIAVSLSDLAAMGGEPGWALLSLTLPSIEPNWLSEFAKGLFSCLEKYKMPLVGGNTTRGPLSITTQVIGFSRVNQFLTRSGAKPADLIFVTGNLGDSGLALKILQEQIKREYFTEETLEKLMNKLWRPIPRLKEGHSLVDLASACIDISDGLAADLKHILSASRVGATLYTEQLPISESVKQLSKQVSLELALTAGDEYELCFTVPPSKVEELMANFKAFDCPLACIGHIHEQLGLTIVAENGGFLFLDQDGYKHF